MSPVTMDSGWGPRLRRAGCLRRDLQESLRSNPSRALLAFVALTLGITTLSLLLAITGGLQARSQALVADLGADVFGILGDPDHTAGPRPAGLTGVDLERLTHNLPDARTTGILLHPTANTGLAPGVRLLGIDADLWQVRPWAIIAGRPIDPEDLRLRRAVAVVSRTLAAEAALHPGDTIRIGRLPHTIVGIAELGGSGPADAQGAPAVAPGERVVLIPRTRPAPWITASPPQPTRLDAIFVRAADGTSLRRALQDARTLVGNAPETSRTPLTWITPDALVSKIERWQRLITLAGGAVVLLCLTLAGATLTSLLLANLAERIPEIGLRRAIGASAADIGTLFLAEAAALTVAAALTGTALTALLIHAAPALLPSQLPLAVGPATFLLPSLAGILLGSACALWPARLAARLAPAEALRHT